MAKITKEQIMDRYNNMKTHYSARNIEFDLDSKYYTLGFRDDLGLPEEYKNDGALLPTARDLVDAGADHVSTAYARFHRPSFGMTKEELDRQEMLRKFDTGLFYLTKMQSPISAWRVANKHAFLHGMFCFETLYDPDRWGNEPEQEADEDEANFNKRYKLWKSEKKLIVPISIRAVHPRSVLPDTALNPNFVIVEETKLVTQAKQDWPNWEAPLVRGGDESIVNAKTVTQISYWDERYRSCFVDGVSVLEEEVLEHDYGFIPYVIGYSGLGNDDYTAAPEQRAVGLIRYLRNLLRSESFAYSMYNIIMKNHSWPVTFASGPGAKEFAAQVKLKYGRIYEKPAGMMLEDYVKAPPPELVMQHMIYTGQSLSASAAPRALRGLGESGVRSAVDREMVIAQGQLRYAGVTEQMQLATAKVMGNCTKIAERIVPDDIHLWAHTPTEDVDVVLSKGEIKNHYITYVEFTPTSPEEEARRHADMMNLVKTRVMSAATGRRRYLPHIDPNEEDIKVEAERLRELPQVQQIMAAVVTAELTMEAQKLQSLAMLRAGVFAGQELPAGAMNAALSMEGGAQQMSAQMRMGMGQSNPALGPEQQIAGALAGQKSTTPVRPARTPFGAGA